MLKGNNQEDGLAVVYLPYQPGCFCHFVHNHQSLSAVIGKVIMQAGTPRGPSGIKTPFILLASKALNALCSGVEVSHFCDYFLGEEVFFKV